MSSRPRVDTSSSHHGLAAVVLQNRDLRVVVLPDLGGKILSLVDLRRDVELLWTHPRLLPRRVPFGADYDDHFVGGWDELYPNDEPEVLAGETFPDHGELWTLPWDVQTGESGSDTGVQAWVELTVGTPVSSTLVRRRLRLGRTGPLTVDYRLENVGPVAQPYLWKSHVAVTLHPDSVIDLGADTLLLHDFGHPRGRPADGVVHWPTLVADGVSHDLRHPPPRPSAVSEFLISTRMAQGWCQVQHPAARTGLRLDFDLADLGSCWTFASYGGWRGLDVLVLEPCTGFPLSVAEGVAAGTHRVLEPGEVRTWRLTASVGVDS